MKVYKYVKIKQHLPEQTNQSKKKKNKEKILRLTNVERKHKNISGMRKVMHSEERNESHGTRTPRTQNTLLE